jgi:hypothetical protein
MFFKFSFHAGRPVVSREGEAGEGELAAFGSHGKGEIDVDAIESMDRSGRADEVRVLGQDHVASESDVVFEDRDDGDQERVRVDRVGEERREGESRRKERDVAGANGS